MGRKNVGKVFEDNWKKSCPDWLFVYRPPDASQSFDMGSKLRFSNKSPCDYFLYNGERLWTIELKSVAGTSISFEREKEDNGVIHFYQVENLKNFSEYKNVISGFLVDFRGSDNTYFLNIKEWDALINSIGKKSLKSLPPAQDTVKTPASSESMLIIFLPFKTLQSSSLAPIIPISSSVVKTASIGG